MPANPGRMNRRLTFQTRTLTRDTTGGRVESWADSFKAWAELVKHDAAEKLLGDSERIDDTKHFRIRWRAGLSAGSHRVLYQLRFYDIQGVTEEGIQDRLLLTCRAVQSLQG